MTTSTDIVNQALNLIGGLNDENPVTGTAPTFDNSAAGVAASYCYYPVVQTVARQFGWDFNRGIAPLTIAAGTPPLGWSYQYFYPSNGIQVRQIAPPTLGDPNNPLPVNWEIGNAVVAGVQSKVIWCNQQNAVAVFTNLPLEGLWDAEFREAVVRLLANYLAMALEGKPDAAQAMLESYAQFAQLGMTRDS